MPQTRNDFRVLAFLTIASLAGACKSVPVHSATGFTFDGFKLGDMYQSKVMSREPYNAPCDNDPIDKRSRRFMVYGALPCRDRTFPEKTTVMFYLAMNPEGTPKYEQPIVAFAWLGGSYFKSRSNFPLVPGDTPSRATEVFGAPIRRFDVGWKRWRLAVSQHKNDIYSIANGENLAGFVVGPMPDDPESEQWRGLGQMWGRYTVGRSK
ncbi:MAG: hypothetical protein HYY84_18725 [Deltaproteobacteria bacterium]|nr:hypothetical protein [Deltaproteobacteria bacterium]